MMKKIIISGDIGWEVMPADIRAALDAAKGSDLEVQIASPGGSVFDGIEIFNMFRDYKRENPNAQILASIKGLAASMATYLAMNPAFDMLTAEDNAVFMIHNAWGGVVGDYRDMHNFAEVLDGLTQIIGKAYSNRTGKPIKKIREMMDKETWLFGSEIKDAGFVDDIIKTDEETDRAAALAGAKTVFKSMTRKLSDPDNAASYDQIAASVRTISEPVKPEHHPAADNSAGKNTQEGKTMTLQELLSQSPAAKIEYDAELRAQFKAGEIAGRESLSATIKTAAKYLGPDGAYPAPIKSLAVDVLNGTKTAEALETTVAAFDALRESHASAAAKDEQPQATPGQQPVTEDDMTAQLKKDKAACGLVEV